jgi:hypothetical protein
MTVRHIKYGAKAEDVGVFATAFIDTVERILEDKWCVLILSAGVHRLGYELFALDALLCPICDTCQSQCARTQFLFKALWMFDHTSELRLPYRHIVDTSHCIGSSLECGGL